MTRYEVDTLDEYLAAVIHRLVEEGYATDLGNGSYMFTAKPEEPQWAQDIAIRRITRSVLHELAREGYTRRVKP
jgi:hypothetical protein